MNGMVMKEWNMSLLKNVERTVYECQETEKVMIRSRLVLT